MRPYTYLGVTVDVCPACGGIWFEEGELRRVMHVDPVALTSLEDRVVPEIQAGEAGETERRCPDCGAVLHPYRYLYNSPIQLDACEQCSGMWVDDGELRKMAQWIQAPLTEEEKARIAVARYGIEHEAEMQRQKSLQNMFSVLRMRVLPWLRY